MKFAKYIIAGLIFGVAMAKAQIISWYRIFEMFHFDSFHMYGIIGSAVILGIIMVQIAKRQKWKDTYGDPIEFPEKAKSIPRYLFGGIIFGLGWALVGACPGPMFVLLGYGYGSIVIVILGGIAGTWLYGALRNKLPH